MIKEEEEEEKKSKKRIVKRKTQWGTVTTEQAPTRWKPNKNNGRGEFKWNTNKIDNSIKYKNIYISNIRIYV